jgi:hypothetical protein
MGVQFEPLAGYNARVSVNGAIVVKADWTFNPTNRGVDATNFEGGGFSDELTSVNRGSGTVKGLWNSADNEFGDPPNIVPGRYLTNLVLYADSSSSEVLVSCPKVRIEATPLHANVEGGIEMEFSFNTRGPFTVGSATPGVGDTSF